MTGHRHRAGLTLVELMVSLLLAGVLVGACWGLLARIEALALLHARRVALGDALRVTEVVLTGELARLHAADFSATTDSVRLRAIRGTAVVCAVLGGDVFVRYRGMRQPEPAKDSVVFVAAGERVEALAAVGSAPQACWAPADEAVQRWNGHSAEIGSVALVFESGSYSLASGALRYRRGRGGRQPLVEDVFDPRASFTLRNSAGTPVAEGVAGAVVEVDLLGERVASGLQRRAARLRIAMLNVTP